MGGKYLDTTTKAIFRLNSLPLTADDDCVHPNPTAEWSYIGWGDMGHSQNDLPMKMAGLLVSAAPCATQFD
jgi:hypothetical protein